MIETVPFSQRPIALPVVGIDFRSRLHPFYDVGNEVTCPAIENVTGENVAIPFDDTENDSLVVGCPVEIATADKSFIDLDCLAGTAEREIAVNVAHVFADQAAHAPSGFVGDTELALDLFRGHTVPGRAEKEHDVKPVPQGRPGALKGRPGHRIDLIAAMLANEGPATLDPVIGRSLLALEAGQPLAVPGPHQVIKAGILVREPGLEVSDSRAFFRHSHSP